MRKKSRERQAEEFHAEELKKEQAIVCVCVGGPSFTVGQGKYGAYVSSIVDEQTQCGLLSGKFVKRKRRCAVCEHLFFTVEMVGSKDGIRKMIEEAECQLRVVMVLKTMKDRGKTKEELERERGAVEKLHQAERDGRVVRGSGKEVLEKMKTRGAGA